LSKPIEIAEDVFWVGYVVPNDPFQCHVYLIRNKDESVLIDPGSMITLPVVLEKITSLVKLKDIKWIIMHHQDPDITGCYSTLESIMPERDDRRVVTHWRSLMLLKHYKWKTPFYLVDKNDWKLTAGDRLLEFIFTPYAHFPGAFCTFDVKTSTLFSSDILGGLSDKFRLFAEDTEDYYEGIILFHKHYMPSTSILNYALRQIKKKKPKIIAPQHGSILRGEMIDKVIEKLEKLDCGLYLIDEKESDIVILNKIDEVLKHFFEDALLSSSFESVLENLFRHIKEKINHVELMEVYGKTDISKDKVAVFLVNEKGVKKRTVEGEYLPPPCSFFVELNDGKKEIGGICLRSKDLTETERKFLDVLFKKIDTPLSISLSRELAYEFLEEANKELMEQVIKDPLTGLYNRRYLFEYLKVKIKEFERFSYPLSLVMIDIDKFKDINDTYGHLVGDCVLKELALILRRNTRLTDCVARYGGEEFTIVMPFADLKDACAKAESIRKSVEKHKFCKDLKLDVTISAGVAVYSKGLSPEEFVKIADENLYKAKNTGRNKVVCK